MTAVVDAVDFTSTLKRGLDKVKSAFVSISASPTLLTISLVGPAVKYRRWIPCKAESGFSEKTVDSALLQKLLASYKGTLTISLSSTHMHFKTRGTVSLPFSDFGQQDNAYEVKDLNDNGGYKGVIKNHPLYHTSNLKRSLQAIKDNVSKEELMVEAKWGGESTTLDVMVIDQFHGVLCRIDISEMGKSKEYDIRLPLSAFLLLLDTKGDITIENQRLEVRGEDFEMSFTFVAVASPATIEDMIGLVSAKSQVKVDGLAILTAAKKATAISEPDDALFLYTKSDNLFLKCETSAATIKEKLPCSGKLPSKIKLTPKNFLDVLASMGASDVEMAVTEGNLVMRTRSKAAIYGAMALME